MNKIRLRLLITEQAKGTPMVEAYQAEYEHTNISIDALLEKYQLTKDDIKGHESWKKPGEVVIESKAKPKRTKKIDKVLQNLEVIDSNPTIVPATTITAQNITTLPGTTATEANLKKIEEFKELALDHCLNFMHRDAKLSEVKEFKDIVAIVNTLETSYQKTDPDAGKPTINILIQNLMERFNDDC